MAHAPGARFLILRLALQNLGRRRTRTGLILAAVAISSAIAFAGAVMMRSIETSMEVGFSRLGADLMVVAQDALANITVALLTVEPTDSTVPAGLLEMADIPGIGRATPQRVFRTSLSGVGGHGESVDLIGFDPDTDFTVQPWILERLPRAMGPRDIIVGAARSLPLGSEVVIFGTPFRVYGKLSPTGVGTHERGVFLHATGLLALGPAILARTGVTPPMLDPARVSGFLIELSPGAGELQVRFALLSRLAGIKVVTGASLLTGIRQGLAALLGGVVALVTLMFASTAIMISVLFSAIVSERRAELGLLKAIGARRGQVVGMTVLEAVIATGAGGIAGVLIGALVLRLFERSLVVHLTQMGVPFLWLDRPSTVLLAVACILSAALIGALGALVPAWRASGAEPYDLIRGEG
ncbi:ABC transporter permease [Xanthobacter dioxanivorans]|uniref:ABC transporter permease n=1 Tax=Xanthobacter dioxanivorans TaxID=2528964 RepID=A0A974PK37_9HYPH|nr:ABC transporter permease [Xanthobacter dioxanivorans]QRG04681.1 ABC transporter permease [Xanthobacter dioxanivorans]